MIASGIPLWWRSDEEHIDTRHMPGVVWLAALCTENHLRWTPAALGLCRKGVMAIFFHDLETKKSNWLRIVSSPLQSAHLGATHNRWLAHQCSELYRGSWKSEVWYWDESQASGELLLRGWIRYCAYNSINKIRNLLPAMWEARTTKHSVSPRATWKYKYTAFLPP